MTDRELLEAAAKAAGITVEPDGNFAFPDRLWNPLDDDGDSLRLAVALQIDIQLFLPEGVRATVDRLGRAFGVPCDLDGDRCAATRRAIVRAAAAIGAAADAK